MSTGSKAVRFALDKVSPNKTRVMTVPDKDGTMVLDTDLRMLMIGLGTIDGGKPDSFYGGARISFGGVT